MNRSARRKLRATEARGGGSQVDLFRKGHDAERAGNAAAAIIHYRQCVAQAPKNADACFRLAGLLREQGDTQGAIAAYKAAAAARPFDVETLLNLAETYRRIGCADEARRLGEEAVAADSARIESFVVRGLIRKGLGEWHGAIDDLRRAVAFSPQVASLHKALGFTLVDAGRNNEARASLEEACRLQVDDGEVFRLLGTLYDFDGQKWKALECFQRAVELDPHDALAYSNMAGMLSQTNQLDLAVSSARIAIQLQPMNEKARFNLGAALERQDKTKEAIQSYIEALACKSDLGDALVGICRLKQQICDWADLSAFQELAPALTYRTGKSVPPFNVLQLTSSNAELLHCARLYALTMKEDAEAPLSAYASRPPARRGERMRIGYLSADYQVHATAALITEIFELHDKTRFEIFGYSIGCPDDSAVRRRLVAAFDHFADLSTMSHRQAAAAIHQDEIDILVDLKGYTFQSRAQILAHRPAPIQVNFLGYPGTMGADFIDYIIGDAVVTPPHHGHFYDERIVTLPHCYQPNDRKRAIGAHVPSRAACGLPQEAFVFCSFNANYKITPAVFGCWMRILEAVPGSVLWLLQSNADAADNLCNEAKARGIDPRRLVFAPRLRAEDHLARLRNGDLFLDTLPVGAHTTASEALWVGLPVLTALGESFAGRVAASLLDAVGLADLVMPSLEAYEAEAIRLAADKQCLAALRSRLTAGLSTAPLFDSASFTRSLERAFARMIDLRDAGEGPRPFRVDAGNAT